MGSSGIPELYNSGIIPEVRLKADLILTQFKLCFDVQRSEHSFVADRSDINLVDDGNNPMSVRR